jgi:hypothetical protein
VICSYCNKHGVKEIARPQPSRQRDDSSSVASVKGNGSDQELPERTRLVAESFNAGVNVKELMERYQVSQGTILEHLTKYALDGNPLRNEDGLNTLVSIPPEQKLAAFAAFQELGPGLLKPVHEKLNGTLSYDILKIVRLLYLMTR